MKFHKLVVALAVSCFLVGPGMYAATSISVSSFQPIVASGKPKLVKFHIQSELTIPLDIKVGENPTTLQPGQTIDVRLPVGAQITVATPVVGHPAGEVIVQVEPLLDDAIIHIKA